MLKRIFKYLEPLWLGMDGKISINRCLAILFAWKVVDNADYIIRKWEQGRSAGDASTILLTLAGLIPVLLGITAWSNRESKKMDVASSIPSDTTINVQKADTVTTGTKVDTVNADKVDTVNTQTTNINKEPSDAK